MLTTLVLVLVFSLIGYLRFHKDEKKPAYFLNLTLLIEKWFSENNWLARLSVLFAPFIFVFNLLVWSVYGLTSILEYVVKILSKIWGFLVWLLLWIYNEVINPVIFSFIKLVWHYLVVFLWKFFHFSFSPIQGALKKDSIIFAFKKLLFLGVISSVLMTVALNTHSNTINLICYLCFFFVFQFTLFSSLSNFRNESLKSNIFPTIKLSAIWLAASGILTAILFVFRDHLEKPIVSGLGVSATVILMPLAVLIGIGVLASSTCLPAYVKEKGIKVNLIDFLKSLLFRLPKLIFAQPFQFIGIAIVGIIPFIIFIVLNFGINSFTGKDFKNHTDDVMSMGIHLPIIHNNDSIVEFYNKDIVSINHIKDSLTRINANKIDVLNTKLLTAKKLKDEIGENKIHSFSENPYVGEEQFFSIPHLPGCADYSWIIKEIGTDKDDKSSIIEKRVVSEPEKSAVFRYTWTKAGSYEVLLTPSNKCGASNVLNLKITVLGLPNSGLKIGNPEGNKNVCVGDTVNYSAPSGYETYEWKLPTNATSDNLTGKTVKVNWGSYSGTVRVRGTLKDNTMPSLWAGIDVNVNAKPGVLTQKDKFIKDDEINIFERPTKKSIYETIEMANDSINSIQNKILDLKKKQISDNKIFSNIVESDNKTISNIDKNSSSNYKSLFGKILSLLGIALLISLIFSTVWTYVICFHFDLFGFEQDGKHYWENMLSSMRNKNPLQPLLGIFVLTITLVLLSFTNPQSFISRFKLSQKVTDTIPSYDTLKVGMEIGEK